MNRCARLLTASRPAIVGIALAGLLSLLAAQPAAAREFPRTALRGKIEFGIPPYIKLNGDTMRMAPGGRIHGINNLLILSGQLVGVASVVDYTLEPGGGGQVYEVWMLSEAEAAKKPWPQTAAEAAAWSFDQAAQTWTKP